MGKYTEIIMGKGSMHFDLAIPDKCPYCRKQIAPALAHAFAYLSDDSANHSVSGFWACNACSRVFCAEYRVMAPNQLKIYPGVINQIIPSYPETTEIDQRIADISPRFVDLFHQSEKAMDSGMSDLAGMGFRKALECLLKDTLIFLKNMDRKQVSEMKLTDAIQTFSDNPKLIKAANQARVIGNDYTHYEAKYEGYDITALQKLISISLYWILMEIETEELIPLTKKPSASN